MPQGIFRPQTKAAYIMTLSGVQYGFTGFSGINDEADSGEYADATNNRKLKVVGVRSVEDVNLTAPFDANLADELTQLWENYDCEFLTITIQPVSCNNRQNIGRPYVCQGCQLKGLKLPEVDRSSSDVSEIELSFTVNTWSR